MTDGNTSGQETRAAILVMDDDDSTRQTIAFYLESRGFRVMETANGADGLDQFRAQTPDLLLVDLFMPRVNGFDVLKAVQEESPDTPLIVISGTEKISDAVDALHMGAWDYVLKPIQNMSILLHAIQKALEKAQLIHENRQYQENLEKEIQQRTLELRKTEEQLRLHQQQLLQADKMASLGILVSGVAHEIANPNSFITVNVPTLQTIWKGAAAVLEDHYRHNGDFYLAPRCTYSEIKDTVPRILDGIMAGGKRIDNHVRELKNFAVPTPQTVSEPVDMAKVIQSAVTLLSHLIRKSTHHFHMRIGDKLPLISGNFQHMEQVIINLLENSCRALPHPDKQIHVTLDASAAGDKLIIVIRDQGTGIAPEHLEQITAPFFTTRRESGGTGLGLSISAKIVEEHGGTLQFESRPHIGTTATLTLPAIRQTDSASEAPQS